MFDLFYEMVGIDIFCNLGLINIDNMLQVLDFGCVVEVVVWVLINVIDIINIEEVFSIVKGNCFYYMIGLGVMGFYIVLVCWQIEYGFLEVFEFIEVYFLVLNYYLFLVSYQIVKEWGEIFVGFKDLCYVDGFYFDDYVIKFFIFKFEKNWVVFLGVYLLMMVDW